MKMIIVSDYIFYENKGNYYAEIPWDEDYAKIYEKKIRFYLMGKVIRGKKIDLEKFYKIDGRYFKVINTPYWKNAFEFIMSIPKIIIELAIIKKEIDIIYLKMFYLTSVIVFLFNCIILNKPVVAHLVGDTEKAVIMRNDLNIKYARYLIAKVTYIINKIILNKSKISIVVCEYLKKKYISKNQNVIIASESWLKKWMYKKPKEKMGCPPKILFVGRLVKYKGIKELTLILIECLTEGEIFDVIIVGDGPEKMSLIDLVNKSGYQDRFKFKGKIKALSKELFDIYREADILCLPSYTEGLPLVILEAMANGVAVIATKVGGIPEIIKHMHNGLLAEPGNFKYIKSLIVSLIHNEKMWKELVMNGYLEARKREYFEERKKAAIKILEYISKK